MIKKFTFSILFTVAILAGCKVQEQEDCINQEKINPEAMCTREYMPVCGCNGQTYGNKCEAKAAGLNSWTEGACPEKPSK